MKPYLIGLTGNIACGKSSVLAMLEELGARVIDADRVTHELQRPGEPVYAAIVAEFGPDILTAPGGPIDRRALGAIVFADPAALRRLEQIVHPAVHKRIEAWLEQVAQEQRTKNKEQGDESREPRTENQEPGTAESRNRGTMNEATRSPAHPLTRSPVAVIDAIKLIESGWKPLCDAIWVVTCMPEQQTERLIATRGMSAAEAHARLAAQPPQADKVAQADVVIDNSGTLDQTRRQVEAAWRAMTR
jgi:dephospho-CoA kinase